ncbi:hypothetical protein BO94DRAFT_530521 [Aspergillus sclerotioniger CBS 115572]|uniref:Erythromycin esterase n=1 Tax=Aspergillus sclerotioniger CBS 115572 TaxID=1450535 RepID=A0A317XB00_9EURO|nr:hypothetical protein BO94DRAFT_530521 [Aspergillus sclerotioniger CBS 115572]PWY95786.1 hypothetical protein BO94DRAFT_530521 [Aspergillus sclerotioniger CBS 115572]
MAVRRSARLRSRQPSEESQADPVVTDNNASRDTKTHTNPETENEDVKMARLGKQAERLPPVVENVEDAATSTDKPERARKRKSKAETVSKRKSKVVVSEPVAELSAVPETKAPISQPAVSDTQNLSTTKIMPEPAKPTAKPIATKLPTSKAMAEPVKLSTPKKTTHTPLKNTPHKNTPTKTPSRTPSSTLARPPHQEMHPSKVHQSTTKQPDSGLVLGFNPIKKDAEGKIVKDTLIENTPTKAKASPASNYYGTPAFEFKFACDMQLSDEAKKLMETVRQDAAKIKPKIADQLAQTRTEQAADRKIVQPRGKADRFSDAHMAEFKKMDSIAGHASAFRATPGRFQPVVKTLKRTNSKARLDESDRTSTSPSKIARPSPAPPPPRPASNKRVKRDMTDDASTRRPTEASPPKPVHTRPRSIRSSLFTPTRSSAARASSSIKPPRTSLIPSLMRSPAAKPADVPRTPQTEFNPRLKSNLPTLGNLKSILRRHQPLFSKDPAKIAAGTHVAAPDFSSNLLFGKRETEEPAQTPSPKKRVEFTPMVEARQEEALFSPSPSKTVSPSRIISDVVYPTLPVLTPEQNHKSPAQATTPTIRHVRQSDVHVNPLPEIAGVPHGIGHKKRTREASDETKTDDLPEIAGVPHGIGQKKRNRSALEDETDAENVPPADSTAEARSAKRMKMTLPSPIKAPALSARKAAPSPAKAIISPAKGTLSPTKAIATPSKVRSHTPLRSATASRKSTPASARPHSRGVLSVSRLNMLAQPKSRR